MALQPFEVAIVQLIIFDVICVQEETGTKLVVMVSFLSLFRADFALTPLIQHGVMSLFVYLRNFVTQSALCIPHPWIHPTTD